METAAILAFLYTLAGVVYCLPPHSEPPDRLVATPLEYMRDLYNEMYSRNSEVTGKLKPSTPTDIWCFSDRGIYLGG